MSKVKHNNLVSLAKQASRSEAEASEDDEKVNAADDGIADITDGMNKMQMEQVEGIICNFLWVFHATTQLSFVFISMNNTFTFIELPIVFVPVRFRI